MYVFSSRDNWVNLIADHLYSLFFTSTVFQYTEIIFTLSAASLKNCLESSSQVVGIANTQVIFSSFIWVSLCFKESKSVLRIYPIDSENTVNARTSLPWSSFSFILRESFTYNKYEKHQFYIISPFFLWYEWDAIYFTLFLAYKIAVIFFYETFPHSSEQRLYFLPSSVLYPLN